MSKNILRKLYPFSVLFQMKDEIKVLSKSNANLCKKVERLESENLNQNKVLKELEKKVAYMERTYMPQLNKKYNILNSKMDYLYYKGLHSDQYEENLKEWYFNKVGMELHLNPPVTYNEKIQWLKLHDHNPMLSVLADKYAVRDYVNEKIGKKYLIPLLAVYNSVEEIDLESLPNKFVVKTNHGCGYNIIVTDKKNENWEENKKKIVEWMKTDFSFKNGFEMQYTNIQPKIIVEEYIENQNQDLYDYKVFCFKGKAKYIMFLSERKDGLKMQFYDTDWKLQPFVYSYERKCTPIAKPDNLEELIECAEKLAQGFCQVRVDFYCLNSGEWKFGEMTFTSASGVGKWNPPDYDNILGEYIDLSMID